VIWDYNIVERRQSSKRRKFKDIGIVIDEDARGATNAYKRVKVEWLEGKMSTLRDYKLRRLADGRDYGCMTEGNESALRRYDKDRRIPGMGDELKKQRVQNDGETATDDDSV